MAFRNSQLRSPLFSQWGHRVLCSSSPRSQCRGLSPVQCSFHISRCFCHSDAPYTWTPLYHSHSTVHPSPPYLSPAAALCGRAGRCYVPCLPSLKRRLRCKITCPAAAINSIHALFSWVLPVLLTHVYRLRTIALPWYHTGILKKDKILGFWGPLVPSSQGFQILIPSILHAISVKEPNGHE